MIKFLVYLGLGKLIIFLLQKFPFGKIYVVGKLFAEGKFLNELFGCDLCLGVWVYSILAYLLQVNFFQELGYTPIIFECITGGFASFVMHIFSLGWNTKFQTIILE